MADVFVSYARQDKSDVEALVKVLADQGWDVFWDRGIEPGDNYADVLQAKLDVAKCVVVVWSENSVGSNWVRDEARIGERRGVLVPVSLDRSDPPLGFGGTQFADLSDWDLADVAHDGVDRTVRKVASLVVTQPAVEPEPTTEKRSENALPEREAPGPPDSGSGEEDVDASPKVVTPRAPPKNDLFARAGGIFGWTVGALVLLFFAFLGGWLVMEVAIAIGLPEFLQGPILVLSTAGFWLWGYVVIEG